MKLAVVGSSDFNNYNQMVKYLSAKKDVELIVTGDAPGADKLVQKYAKEAGIPIKMFPFQPDTIVDNSDAVLAFWNGKSEGTQDLLKIAKRDKKKIEVVFLESRELEPAFGYIAL